MASFSKRIAGPLIALRDSWMFADNRPGAGWGVQSRRNAQRLNPFFLIGHPRSGTTLLRAVLSGHSDVFIPPENGTLWRMVREFGGARRSSWEDIVDQLLSVFAQGYEFDQWQLDIASLRHEALALAPEHRTLADFLTMIYVRYGATHAPGKSIFGDKTTPGSFDYLEKLEHVFPKAAYVHIVRDGRDCVASAIKAGFFEKNYLTAATAWRDNVRTCRRFGNNRKRDGRYLEIRYEDLTSDTSAVVTRICEFLELPQDAGMQEHHLAVDKQLPDVKSLVHHENVTRPIFGDSIGKWQRQIPAELQEDVINSMRAELVFYRYL